MKEDKLDQFVKDNAEGFNILEPPSMAWEAIEKELPENKSNKIRRFWPYAWKAAAAVLIFASAWLLNDYMDYKKHTWNTIGKATHEVIPELSELSDAEAYYTSQISSRQTELQAYTKEHPEIIADLKKEFREIDKNKDELKNDLAESNADEKVIEAIIQSYRVKLDILDQMLTELRKTNDANSKKNRPVEINL